MSSSRWTNDDLNKAKSLLISGKAYKEIGLILNRSDMAVRNAMQHEFNIKRTMFRVIPHIDKICKHCNKHFSVLKSADKQNDYIFCSKTCASRYNANLKKKDRTKVCEFCKKEYKATWSEQKYCSNRCQVDHQSSVIINDWLTGKHSGSIEKHAFILSEVIRKYLIKTADNKCQKCGWHEINEHTGKVPLQINHIDGDATNNRPENLEVLCPNCHSLTSNFGQRGQASTRRKYRHDTRTC